MMEKLIEIYSGDNKKQNKTMEFKDNRHQSLDSSIQLCKARSQALSF